jgi:WD40 repeat protein
MLATVAGWQNQNDVRAYRLDSVAQVSKAGVTALDISEHGETVAVGTFGRQVIVLRGGKALPFAAPKYEAPRPGRTTSDIPENLRIESVAMDSKGRFLAATSKSNSTVDVWMIEPPPPPMLLHHTWGAPFERPVVRFVPGDDGEPDLVVAGSMGIRRGTLKQARSTLSLLDKIDLRIVEATIRDGLGYTEITRSWEKGPIRDLICVHSVAFNAKHKVLTACGRIQTGWPYIAFRPGVQKRVSGKTCARTEADPELRIGTDASQPQYGIACAWNLDTGDMLAELWFNGVCGAAVTDDNMVLTCVTDRTMSGDYRKNSYKWDINRREFQKISSVADIDIENREIILRLALSDDGNLIAFPRKKGEVVLVDTASGRVVQTLGADGVPLLVARFSKDGNWVVAGNEKGCVYLWKRMVTER